jgi:superfamily II DNA/RNA helicase
MSSISFPEMGLAAPLLTALQNMGFSEPTAVQASIIPQAIAGGDWMVSSQTGSGKTLAFLLPLLHHLLSTEGSQLKALVGPAALVLCPTRELAQQVAQDAIDVLKHQRVLRVATVLGGMPFGKQLASLRGAQLVVATPGRLLDLVNQRKIRLDQVRTLVLDEADRMLDLGFAEDLDAIHQLCSARQQTLMFSATFMPRIMGLAENIMNQPQRLELTQSHQTNDNIEQQLCWARNAQQKRKMLNHWLEQPEVNQAIVFTSTQLDTETIARTLSDDGIMAAPLHGAMPQALRNRRIRSLREGRLKVLVATDVAARGIDVPAITHVINFGLPMKAEDYVHRIGRTGRAGRQGLAVTLAEPSERRKVVAIERYIRNKLPVANLEGFEPVQLSEHQGGQRRGGGRSGGYAGGRSGERFGDRSGERSGDRFAQRAGQRSERSFDRRPQNTNERSADSSGERSSDHRKSWGEERRGAERFGSGRATAGPRADVAGEPWKGAKRGAPKADWSDDRGFSRERDGRQAFSRKSSTPKEPGKFGSGSWGESAAGGRRQDPVVRWGGAAKKADGFGKPSKTRAYAVVK